MDTFDRHTSLGLSSSRKQSVSVVKKPRYSLPDIRQVDKHFRRTSLPDKNPKRKESEALEEELAASAEPCNMYIVIKYANNQSLVVNPMCSVVNLLSSIKSKTGHAEDKDMLLDLSDETGLIQDLEVHGREYATKFLSSHGTYILMEKKLLLEGKPATPSNISHALHSYNYVPLLERCAELYPNFKIHLSEAQKKKLKPLKNVAKNPSPAGKMPTTKNPQNASRSLAGRPPRSGSRGRKP